MNEFPKGADERIGDKNDSAVALYVLFPKRFFIPEAIKYVWSEKAPAEKIIARKKRFPTIVVRSGTSCASKWQTEMRNVKADYEKHFGRKAPKPVAVGFLTDANAVKGKAAGDYDEVIAYRTASGQANP